MEFKVTHANTVMSLLEGQLSDGDTSKIHGSTDRQSFSAKVVPKSDIEELPQQPLYHRAIIVDDSHVVRKMLAKSITSQFHYIEHVKTSLSYAF